MLRSGTYHSCCCFLLISVIFIVGVWLLSWSHSDEFMIFEHFANRWGIYSSCKTVDVHVSVISDLFRELSKNSTSLKNECWRVQLAKIRGISPLCCPHSHHCCPIPTPSPLGCPHPRYPVPIPAPSPIACHLHPTCLYHKLLLLCCITWRLLYCISEKYGVKWYSTDEVYKVYITSCSWIISDISSVNYQVLHCCLPTSTLLFAKFLQIVQEQQMVNSFWIELRSAVIQSPSSHRKDSFKRSTCRWCWQDRSSTQCSTWAIYVLSTPIAEHIRSTVTRADGAVEFILVFWEYRCTE